MKISAIARMFCLCGVVVLFSSGHAAAQVRIVPGKRFWTPSCPGGFLTTNDQRTCIGACVANYDPENYTAYIYYCETAYDDALCSEAIDRLDTATCQLACCKPIKSADPVLAER